MFILCLIGIIVMIVLTGNLISLLIVLLISLLNMGSASISYLAMDASTRKAVVQDQKSPPEPVAMKSFLPFLIIIVLAALVCIF